MKEERFQIAYQSFDSTAQLSEPDRELIESAATALETAYAPYSGFLVGAAVRLANGQIIPGSNQENAAYPMCLCAERVALAAAASQFPDVPVTSLAVTCRNLRKEIDTPVSPCGACRQFICETEHRFQQPISILLRGESGPVYKFNSCLDLLPLAFTGEML